MARTTYRTYDATLGRERTWRDNLGRFVGEMASALRTTAKVLNLTGGAWAPYTLDSSQVDYELARNLYRNTADKYKLGAFAARPVINTCAGFMGVPRFKHVDESVDQVLEDQFGGWEGRLLRINRNAMRDGDQYARLWVAPDPFTEELEYQLGLVPPEWVDAIKDPLTGSIMQAIIVHQAQWKDKGIAMPYQIVETITRTRRTQEVVGFVPDHIKAALTVDQANVWGFVPLVHFKNEAEEYQVHGQSDLEPIEPFMRAYHDVAMNAVQGSRLFSRPKAAFALEDVNGFLQDNFSETEIKSGKLNFAGKDLFFMKKGDTAHFITAETGVAGVTTLQKFLFFCMVDVSETPEFAFGTALSSSKASAETQMVPMARKIRRKRGMYAEPYTELASMFLAMRARKENAPLPTYKTTAEWEPLEVRNDVEVAKAVKDLIDGLVTGMESGLVSQPAAVEFLREFVPTMLPYVAPDGSKDGERERIAQTFAMLERIKDGQGMGDEGNRQRAERKPEDGPGEDDEGAV